MNPIKLELMREFMFFCVAIVGMGCFTGMVTTWIKRKTPKNLGVSAELLNRLEGITDRLERLDNAVDTISVEVERISENQRFTTKLLSERAQAPAPVLVEKQRVGSTTPH
jgi:hypothetical protein